MNYEANRAYERGFQAGVTRGMVKQRDQLRTDEAVEMVARALFEEDQGETMEEHQEWCGNVTCKRATGYTPAARAAINALLGEQP